jgi:DNA polymerase elongation subunit (family B)
MKLSEIRKDPQSYEVFDPTTSSWVDYKDSCYAEVIDGGFPDPKFALGMIQLITVQNINTKRCFTWGTKSYKPTKQYSVETSYTLCKSEKDLLKLFLMFWEAEKPDVVTGWNIDGFDIPYLMNRIDTVLGREYTKKLSPWGLVDIGIKTYKGVDEIKYSITGIAVLDYMLLYKKFTFSNHESYSLAGISGDELGETKLENPTEGFSEFFSGKTRVGMELPDEAKYFFGKKDNSSEIVTTNSIYYLSILANTKQDTSNGIEVIMPNRVLLDIQSNSKDASSLFLELEEACYSTFVEYNIQDTVLITKLDDKLRLLELALTIAYEAKINYNDVYSPVKTWDAIIHNYLLDKKIVSPQRKSTGEGFSIEGAYVKTPRPGMYRNVVTFDFTSLYPSIMRALNISPETYLGQCDSNIDRCLSGDIENKDPNICMGVNGSMYSKTTAGIIPEIIKIYMKKRRDAKNEMLSLESEMEKLKTDGAAEKILYDYSQRISALNNQQMAYKINLNSLYGALANAGFRYYNSHVAESITTTGQLLIRGIENNLSKKVNETFKHDFKDVVIAGDTDSVMLCLDEIVKKYSPNTSVKQNIKIIEKLSQDKISPLIQSIVSDIETSLNVCENTLVAKHEIAASHMLILAKKKYCARVYSSEGVSYSKPKQKIMGMEIIKSSTPKVVRQALKDSIDLIFDGSEKDVQKYIEDTRKKFMAQPVENVAFPRGVTSLDDYADSNSIYGKRTPIHARAALLYNHLLKKKKLTKKYDTLKNGSKLRFVYLKEPNSIRENTIGWPVDGNLPVEFGLHQYIDWDLQFEKVFVSAIELMIAPMGWKTEHRNDLSEFF